MKLKTIFFIFVLSLSVKSQTYWRTYKTGNSNSPINNWITVCINDLNDKFVSKTNYGIYLLNQTDTFKSFSAAYIWNFNNSACDTNNHIFVSATGYGVFKYNGTGWQTFNTANSFSEIQYAAEVKRDSANDVWVRVQDGGTITYGFIKFRGTSQQLYRFSNGKLPFDGALSFGVVDSNNIWIGSLLNGIAHWNGSSWTTYTSAGAGITIDAAQDFAIDGAGNVWVTTNGNGLLKFNGTTWTSFTTANSTIASDKLKEITIDKNGKLWIASFSSGLVEYDGVSFTKYTVSNSGLPWNTITDVKVDAYNNIWLATSNGLAVFNEAGIVGVEEISSEENNFTVYPNPNNGNFNISCLSSLPAGAFSAQEGFHNSNIPSKIESISVCDIFGRECFNEKIVSEKNPIEIKTGNLNSGIYFVRMKTSGGIFTKRIVIE